MRHTVLIADDEPLARSRLVRLLNAITGIEVVGEAGDGKDAVAQCLTLEPDIVLMDIQMPKQNGLNAALEICALMKNAPAIIFCTAYDQYAIDAIEASAVAYLMKPVSAEDLKKAIERTARLSKPQLARLAQVRAAADNTFKIEPSVVSRLKSGLLKTPLNEIAYFKSAEKLVYATTVSGKEVIVDVVLKELVEQFPDELLRIHRNCVVNKGQLERLYKNDKGKDVLKLRAIEQLLEVSRRQLADVKRSFKDQYK